MKQLITLLLVFSCLQLAAQDEAFDSSAYYIEQVETSLTYQTGVVNFDSIGSIVVPVGFRFLDAKQSEYVLTQLWGNPNGECMGMLVPEDLGVLSPNSWVFILTYDPMGYVKDDDADDIDYDELLATMKEEMTAENEERNKQGYESIELVGWASPPFYDEDNKILHWAKELRFGETDTTTLNYNVRILGRKGVLVMNAVATMNELPLVKENIDKVHASFTFGEGLQYKDFDPEIDDVAAWTIGGLVAGKMLAKVGVLAFLLKYIKLIGIGLFALGAGAWRWFKGRSAAQNPYAPRDSEQPKTPSV